MMEYTQLGASALKKPAKRDTQVWMKNAPKD